MSFLGISSSISKYLGSEEKAFGGDSPIMNDSRHSPPDAHLPKLVIRPSVDSAVDMTSPDSATTPVHRLSSPSSPSQTSPDSGEGGGGGGGGGGRSGGYEVSRSISFSNEFRDFSFDGEPDIPELVMRGRQSASSALMN